MLHIQLLSHWCCSAAVTVHVCHGSFVLVLSGSLKWDTFAHKKIRANFFSFFRKLFTFIHLIPWLICHWNLKQSAFYWECPNFEKKKFKLASKTFLLSPPYLSKKCVSICVVGKTGRWEVGNSWILSAKWVLFYLWETLQHIPWKQKKKKSENLPNNI